MNRRRFIPYSLSWLLVGMLFFSARSPSSAQESPTLLQGPLLVTTAITGDGFLIFDLGTGQQRQLSFGAGIHLIGGFSPDGCQIVFSWERTPDQYDLFAARLDGSDLRQLMFLGRTGAIHYRVLEPSWSPDGSRIVFSLVRDYDPPDEDPYRESYIAWVSPEGGRPTFYSESGKEWQPRWSPDGRYLAYVSEQPIVGGQPVDATPTDEDDIPTRPEIWIIEADGSNRSRFMGFTDGGAYNPRWSPDGSRIAFLYEPVSQTHHIMSKVFEGEGNASSVNRSLATVLDFDWQPDGQGLTAAIQGLGGVRENILWNFRFDDLANPTRLIPDEEMLYMDYPRYSPDGKWLAFRKTYELVIQDLQQGTLQFFGEQSEYNSPPVWSPSGFQGEQACRP